MGHLFLVFCVCFVVSFFWESYLKVINYRYAQDPKLKDKAKEQFHLSYEDSDKALAYRKDRFFYSFYVSLVSTAATVVVIFSGLFGYLEGVCEKIASSLGFGSSASSTVEGLVFFAICICASTLINLPFSYYSQFVIEQKHGFNKMTRKLFVIDSLKSLIISLILTGVVLVPLLWFISNYELWWLYSWIFISIFSVVLTWVYPTFIQPLFNTFTPLQKDGDLNQALIKLAKKAEFNVDDISTMNASIRSTHGNAYFSGIFKKKIVLYDTLVKALSASQVAAVLAHELGHFKLGHIRWGVLRTILKMGIVFWMVSYLAQSEAMVEGFGFSAMEPMKPYVILLFFFLWQGVVESILTPIMSYISRRDEFAADAYAVSMVNGKDLVDGLLKLSKNSHQFPFFHPLYSMVYHSHPPLTERFEAIQKAMTTTNASLS
ncbi:MAG: M48 family metallopeptidase [Proteobacteria bacterium]|nr:M48 family metallopeptidase [Pseudomonadota bacterium]